MLAHACRVPPPDPLRPRRRLTGVAVTVHIPQALRAQCAGAPTVAIDVPEGGATSLRAVLTALDAAHPALVARVLDEQGRLRRHVNVFVDGSGLGGAEDLQTQVGSTSEIWILPAVSGGCPSDATPWARTEPDRRRSAR